MSHSHVMPTTFLSDLLDALALFSAFVFTVLVVDPEWQNLLVAIGGSFSGAFILAYFRRDPRKMEQVYKVVCASVCGLITGSAAHLYLGWADVRAVLIIFFLCGLLSLTLLQGLYNLTEKNSGEIIKAALQRLFGLRTPEEKKGRRGDTGTRGRGGRNRER